MNRQASFPFKLSYCLAVLGTIVPMGLASSGWVRASTGGSLVGLLPFTGPMLFFALGLYRVFLVARVPGTLDSLPVTGVAMVLRAVGVFCIYAGAVVGILNWVSLPLMRLLVTRPSETGVEFYVVGVYLALAGGVGVLGLLLFEFSRLLGFERARAPKEGT
jgi:hypothetical protein